MWTFGKRITLGFALSFVLLVAVGSAAYRSIGTLARTSALVNHTHTVVEHLAALLSVLKDAETGQRGYVITGDDPFLEPYRASTAALPGMLKELRRLTADNPRHQAHLDEVEPLVSAKLGELERTIQLRRTSGFEAAYRVVQSGEGKRTMDGIRRVLGEMDADAHILLRERAEEVEAASGSTRSTIVIGTLLCLLLVVASGFVIVRALTRQIGSAVHHVQSSSTELEAAANQQVSGAREQSTA